jgi:hypothetical protein
MGFVWRYLIRREFLVEQGLRFEEGRLIEDLPFTLEAVVRARSIVTAPGAMYYYMKRGGSILNSRDRAHMLKVKRDYRHARDMRRELMRRHNLTTQGEPFQKIEYKFLGIPMVYKCKFRNGRTKWYFLGIRILQKKHVRP